MDNKILNLIKKVNKSQGFYKIAFHIEKTYYFPENLINFSATSKYNKIFFDKPFPIVIDYHSKCDKEGIIFMPKKEFDSFYKYFVGKIIHPQEFKKIKKKIDNTLIEFKQYINTLNKINTRDLSEKEILKIYKEYIEKVNEFRVYALLPNLISLGENNITTDFYPILLKKLNQKELSILTTPASISDNMKSENDLLKLIKDNKLDEINIKKWIRKYGHIYYYYIGPLPSVDDVKKMAIKLKKEYKNINKKINGQKNYKNEILLKKKKVMSKIKLNSYEKNLTNVLSYFALYKLERKDLLQKSYVALDKIFYEISKKVNLTVDELKYLHIKELSDILFNKSNKNINKYKNLIKSRQEKIMFISHNDAQTIIDSKKDIKNYFNLIKIAKEKNNRLLIAYSGNIVKGILIFINKKDDLKKIEKLNENFILGSHSTYPDLLPAMIKAKGIITEMGGITSHAAIVSRELKKPCIVGYANLFTKFNEGDHILLDTKNGIIKKL